MYIIHCGLHCEYKIGKWKLLANNNFSHGNFRKRSNVGLTDWIPFLGGGTIKKNILLSEIYQAMVTKPYISIRSANHQAGETRAKWVVRAEWFLDLAVMFRRLMLNVWILRVPTTTFESPEISPESWWQMNLLSGTKVSFYDIL